MGAILVASAIAAGLSRAKIILFTASVFVFTVLTGVFFSYAGTSFIANIKSSLPSQGSALWAVLNIIIITVICVWLYKKSKPTNNAKPQRKLTGSAWAILAAGIAFGVSAIFDPTFLAVISLAGQSGNLLTIITMHTVWILVSQIILFGLFVAYMLGKHQVVLQKSKAAWHKHKNMFTRLLYAAAVVSIVILLTDTLAYFITGSYLIL